LCHKKQENERLLSISKQWTGKREQEKGINFQNDLFLFPLSFSLDLGCGQSPPYFKVRITEYLSGFFQQGQNYFPKTLRQRTIIEGLFKEN
jgi:hypothetical protein